MKFEDLFVKQRPPKDYVTYPPQEIPTLEKFLSERTPKAVSPVNKPAPLDLKEKEVVQPVKPEIAKVAAETPKITDQEVQSIQASIFQKGPATTASPAEDMAVSPEMGMQEQAVKTSTPVATSDLLDVKKIREQADSMMPEVSWADIATGLIPVGLDVLSGGYGDALGIAGDYYMGEVAGREKKRSDLESKLMEINKARQLASIKAGGKAQKVEVDVNGKPIITPLSEAWGKQAWKAPQKPAGISDEQWMKRQSYLAKLKGDLQNKKLTAAQQKDIMDREMNLSKEWSTAKFTEGTRKVTDAFRKISSISPTSANPVQDMGLIFSLMKALDEDSVVRESEQAMAIGARSYTDVVKYFNTLLSGERKLTPPQVLNIKKFAAGLYNRRMEGQKLLDQGYISRAGRYNLNPENIVQTISSGVPILWKNSKTGEVDVIVLPESRVNAGLPEGATRLK